MKRKFKAYSGEMEAARRGGRQALIELYAAMVKSIEGASDDAPAKSSTQRQRAFEFDDGAAPGLPKVADVPRLAIDYDERAFFEACVEIVPDGIMYQKAVAEAHRKYCADKGIKVRSSNKMLGGFLRRWLRVKLAELGRTPEQIEHYLTEKEFIGRDSKRGYRPLYYKSLRLISNQATDAERTHAVTLGR